METKELTKIEGIKAQMTQVFGDNGRVTPVTAIKFETEVSKDWENKPIKLVGTSKGKGFAGAMKKWNFKGQMATRGQSDSPRKPGSPGGQTPGRVLPGKKMAGHLGNVRVTIKSSKIVSVDVEKKSIMVSGPVPGARNSKVMIEIL